MKFLDIDQIEVDHFNSRIIGYIFRKSEDITSHFSLLQEKYATTKTIVYTLEYNLEFFYKDGYHLEGKIDGFFLGQDAFIISKFFDSVRSETFEPYKKKELLEIVMKDRKNVSEIILEPSFYMRLATSKDVNELGILYKKVFKIYPTNVFDPNYLSEHIGDNYMFVVIKHDNKIIAAASAMIKMEYQCAEITDCVTDPLYRGRKLMLLIIQYLEKKLLERNIRCLFSLTRADSIGMNMTVHRLGYQYRGTLVNNCNIFSGTEDMNVWSKYIQE